ncbi:MAG: TetR/AcrR family transcriptional regulator C-terminal domain-containing protein [Acidimicrobiia bacterium]|nr:TetR/AcrR family transcriptional regulator C-terminal domain-containing protein [Acidimicrobiia bacterium]
MSDNADDDPAPAPGSARWWLARETDARPSRQRADGITLRRILDAALLVLQEEGADALTMRRVAERLDTGAASLYRHIASRDELVVLLVDDVIGLPKSNPIQATDWRQRLIRTARNLRGHLLQHRAVVPLITAAQMIGPSSMRGREAVLRYLLADGFDPETAIRIHMTVTHFTVATVQLESRLGARTASERSQLRALFAAQGEHGLSLVSDHAELFAAHESDTEFEFGLAALIHGFEHLRDPPNA